ncbi:MAG: glycosyltransferase family 4 protein [Verrucomicrobiales bacterium]
MPRSLRVLMPCWEFPPFITGGLGVACGGLATELAKWVNLQVVSPGEVWGSHYEAGGFSQEEFHLRVEVFSNELRARGKAGEFERIDLVHAHDWMSFPAALALHSDQGTPFIAHLHSLELDRSPRGPSARIRAVERRGMEAARLVVVVSHHTAKTVIQHYGIDPRKVRVVHNGVLPVVSWREARGTPWVVFIGRLTAQKAPEVFLRAACRLAEQFPRVRFVVAGEGDLWGKLRQIRAFWFWRSIPLSGVSSSTGDS